MPSEPLAPHTSLRLGGPARAIITATSDDDIRAALDADPNALVLGRGTNVVIADAGYPASAVLIRTSGITVVDEDAEFVLVRVAAGHDFDEFVRWSIDADLAGLASLSGVPGSTGATPIQNVGAYGEEVAGLITAVQVLDRRVNAVVTMAPDQCGFSYRSSVFKRNPRYVVLGVEYRLPRRSTQPARYPELAAALDVAVGSAAGLAEMREAVLRLRRSKGMVLDPADPDTRSVGSFFTNPILNSEQWHKLAAVTDGAAPHWPQPDGGVKTSAAWLIGRAGFGKGYQGDGVAISSKHTLALVNTGAGTTASLLGLAAEIRDGVLAQFGVALEPEPVLVGVAL